MKLDEAAAATVAAVLGPDAILHLFWAVTGSSWPASNPTALGRGLLNVDVALEPLNLLVIASMPIAATVLVLARAGMLGRLGRRLPPWMPKLGTLALTAGVSLRLVAGIVWALGIGANPSSTFYWLNLAVYTPLCAVLAIASIIVLRSFSRGAGVDLPTSATVHAATYQGGRA
jgi:hypothetical protein